MRSLRNRLTVWLLAGAGLLLALGALALARSPSSGWSGNSMMLW